MEKINKIIKGCISGKKEAQRSLYDMYSSKMFGMCLQYSKNYEEAQDVLQDGFVKVYRNLRQYSNKGSFEGWVRKIIINTAIEHFRKKNYLYTLEDEISYCDDYSYEDVINEISASDILKFVGELSPQYKMVFNLYAIEGYSHKEISEMLNISEGTSKSNLSRSRAILQQKVRKYFEFQEKIV